VNNLFLERVHPALMDMAERLLADSSFETEAHLVAWLDDQVVAARSVVERYNVLVTGNPNPSAEIRRRLASAWDNLNFLVDELRAHREILEAQQAQ
jgi:hypothetical protein